MAESVFQELLKKKLAINYSESMRLIARAPHAYKTYPIKKADGGVRFISQPAKETKFIMRWLVDNVFADIPVHSCAKAYRRGSSVKKNAEVHFKNRYLTKLDFSDFFSSVTKEDVERHLGKFQYRAANFDEVSIGQMARLCCISKGSRELVLSIGSPASPILSNSIMYEFDERISEWCIKNNVLYTRYADDLTFSTNVKFLSFSILDVVEDVLKKISYPSLSINNSKTVYASKKGHRRITGVVINNEDRLSLGRDRKRKISSMIHKSSLGLLTRDELGHLQGLLGFAKDVEPLFLLRMEKKYGQETLKRIFEIKN